MLLFGYNFVLFFLDRSPAISSKVSLVSLKNNLSTFSTQRLKPALKLGDDLRKAIAF
jgi:hypothetical protein